MACCPLLSSSRCLLPNSSISAAEVLYTRYSPLVLPSYWVRAHGEDAQRLRLSLRHVDPPPLVVLSLGRSPVGVLVRRAGRSPARLASATHLRRPDQVSTRRRPAVSRRATTPHTSDTTHTRKNSYEQHVTRREETIRSGGRHTSSAHLQLEPPRPPRSAQQPQRPPPRVQCVGSDRPTTPAAADRQRQTVDHRDISTQDGSEAHRSCTATRCSRSSNSSSRRMFRSGRRSRERGSMSPQGRRVAAGHSHASQNSACPVG
jgi:hypothetical protein